MDAHWRDPGPCGAERVIARGMALIGRRPGSISRRAHIVEEVAHLVANARLCRRRGYGKRHDVNPDPGNGHADPRDEFDVEHQKSLPNLVLVSIERQSVVSGTRVSVSVELGGRRLSKKQHIIT